MSILNHVRFVATHGGVTVPKHAHDDDAGVDLRADEEIVIEPWKRHAISTGLKAEIPRGTHLEIRSRSGQALKSGVVVLNSPGTVDSGYRGEIKVILVNFSEEPYQVKKGMKIAQAVLVSHIKQVWIAVARLSDSQRGVAGFGSTDI